MPSFRSDQCASSACLFLVTLLFSSTYSASGATITIKEGVSGQTCFVQPLDFKGKTAFSYVISLSPNSIQPAGCDPSNIYVSRLYMSGTCLDPPNNDKKGCSSSSGTVISGTTASSGEKVSVNDTTALCNQVFEVGASEALDTNIFTLGIGTVYCSPSSTGYIYFQNNCPANTSQTVFTMNVQYNSFSSTCSGSSSGSIFDSNTFDAWPITVGVVVGVFVLVFLCLCICGAKRRRQQQMNAVQMVPAPPNMPPMGHTGFPPPPPTYTAGSTPNPVVYSHTANDGGVSNVPPPPVDGYPAPQYTTPEGANQPAVWYKPPKY